MTVPAGQPGRSAPDQATLDRVFGDVLPDTTRDERSDDGRGSGRDERWYSDNRPPHHGG